MTAHPDRVLAVAITVLPARHRAWGRAMQAELATINNPAERSRFARSCVRAVCASPLAVCGMLARLVVAAMTLVAVAFAANAAPGVGVQAGALVVVLVGFSVAGTRASWLGPVGASPVAGCWRMVGYLLVGSLLLGVLQPRNGGPTHDPAGFWVAGAMITIFLIATLRLTSQVAARTLLVIGASALGTAGVWSGLMLSFTDARTMPLWTGAAIVVAGALAAAACYSRGSLDQVAVAAVGAVFAVSVSIFIAVGLTYRAEPSLVPNVAGAGIAGGLTVADRQETNRNEAIDPYVAVLLIGALAGLVTVGAVGTTTRRIGSPARAPATSI
jgi:hypothetical protein